VQGRNSLLLVDIYAIKLQDMPFLCTLVNYVDRNYDRSVNNVLAICGISSNDELCDDHMGCGRTQEKQGICP